MTNKNIILISKEIFRKDLLGIYQGRKKTPHIDAIASRGTVFNNYYTGGCSTAMAVTTMFSGINPYELSDRGEYKPVKPFTQTETIFQKFHAQGYACHVVWPRHFDEYVEQYINIFDETVHRHSLFSVSRFLPTTRDWTYHKNLEHYDPQSDGAHVYLNEALAIIAQSRPPVFLWMHLPHVLTPYHVYEEDFEAFDAFIGELDRQTKADLFITADHGQMRGEKNQYTYGFSPYQGTACIPLITPRLSIGEKVDFPVGANQLMNIVLNRQVEKKEFIYCDTHYYKQTNRKLMICSGRFKYIFTAKTKSEELYDLAFDPDENINLLRKYYFAEERNLYYPYEQLFHYPAWDEAHEYYQKLKKEWERIWKKYSWYDYMHDFLLSIKQLFKISTLKHKFTIKKELLLHGSGRWGSTVQENP